MKEIFLYKFQLIAVVLVIAVLGGLIFFLNRGQSVWQKPSSQTDCALPDLPDETRAKVVKVIDGDTFKISPNLSVRILGIDAPELGEKCYQPAKERLVQLILGRQVVLERSSAAFDKYCRYLRDVKVEGQNVALLLTTEGLARTQFFPNDTQYHNALSQAQIQAKSARQGCLWQEGPSQSSQAPPASLGNDAANPDIQLTSARLKQIIAAGVGWLKQAQEPSGHFKYEYRPLQNKYSQKDLMVRQTGALYILGEILRKLPGDPYQLKEPIERALGYFKANSATGEFRGYRFRCVLRNQQVCSLGATSLTIVGILDLIEAYPQLKEKYSSDLADYLSFLLAMKRERAGFRGFYYLKGVQKEIESHFSNGEAFLALARFYKYSPDHEVKKTLQDAFAYFKRQYNDNWNYEFYLWGMAAFKELQGTGLLENYYQFVKDFTDWRVLGFVSRHNLLTNACAYIEGVISAYPVLEPRLSALEKQKFLEEINFWLGKSQNLQATEVIRLQYSQDQELYTVLVKDAKKAQGGFLNGFNEPAQRIDYTQHCLSSFLQALIDVSQELGLP